MISDFFNLLVDHHLSCKDSLILYFNIEYFNPVIRKEKVVLKVGAVYLLELGLSG